MRTTKSTTANLLRKRFYDQATFVLTFYPSSEYGKYYWKWVASVVIDMWGLYVCVYAIINSLWSACIWVKKIFIISISLSSNENCLEEPSICFSFGFVLFAGSIFVFRFLKRLQLFYWHISRLLYILLVESQDMCYVYQRASVLIRQKYFPFEYG